MNKFVKNIFAFTVVFTILSSDCFAIGAGVQLSIAPGINFNNKPKSNTKPVDFNAIGNIKCSQLPFAFGFGISLKSNNSDFSFGGSGFIDYYAIESQLKNNFNFYSGIGIGNNFHFSNERNFIDYVYNRIFAGLTWLFFDNYIEFFIQQNVCPGFKYNISKNNNNFKLTMPFETGVRWHF